MQTVLLSWSKVKWRFALSIMKWVPNSFQFFHSQPVAEPIRGMVIFCIIRSSLHLFHAVMYRLMTTDTHPFDIELNKSFFYLFHSTVHSFYFLRADFHSFDFLARFSCEFVFSLLHSMMIFSCYSVMRFRDPPAEVNQRRISIGTRIRCLDVAAAVWLLFK